MTDYKTLEKYVGLVEMAQYRRTSTATLTDLDKVVYKAFPEIAQRANERINKTLAACDRLEAYAMRRLHELTRPTSVEICSACGDTGM
jgi:hypothetical protein